MRGMRGEVGGVGDLPKGITDQLLDVVKVFDDLTKNSCKTESQVFVFINAVLCYLCKDLKNDLVFTYEGDVSGSYIIADGKFELIMSDRKNGSKICLAEAKKDNMDQGEVQCLVGCEAVSDMEAKINVYGIVSSGFCWHPKMMEFIDTRLLPLAVTASIQVIIRTLNAYW